MDRDDHLALLGHEGAALARAAAGRLGADVPSCPGWTVADVVGHTAQLHRWVAGIVRERATQRPAHRPPPPGHGDLLPWYEEGLDDLLTVLRAADPVLHVWGWGGDPTVGFWCRRMAHETAVHRWDVEAATGAPAGFARAGAADGVDEYLDVVLRRDVRSGRRRPVGTLHVHATDGEGEWWVGAGDGDLEVRRAHVKADVALRGPAADLLLVLWGRRPASDLDLLGDEARWATWREAAAP